MAADPKPVQPQLTDELTAKIASSVAAAVAEATVKVQERIAPVESRHPSLASPFNPEGLKVRPRLARRYVFCGGDLHEGFLTNREIEALNRIAEPGEYHRGQWRVRVRRDDGGNETVFFELPVKEIDQRMELPNSMLAIINEIVAERDARKSA